MVDAQLGEVMLTLIGHQTIGHKLLNTFSERMLMEMVVTPMDVLIEVTIHDGCEVQQVQWLEFDGFIIPAKHKLSGFIGCLLGHYSAFTTTPALMAWALAAAI